MALTPKQIRILERKERSIIKADKELIDSLTPVEARIFEAIKDQLSRLNRSGGKFEFDETNTNLVNELDQIIVDQIQQSDYPGSVREFLQNYDTVTDFNKQLHDSLNDISPAELEEFVDPFKKQAVEDTLTGLTGAGVRVEFVEPLRQELFRNIVAGVNAEDIEQNLRVFIMGSEDRLGKLNRYVSQVTRDALNQYDGQINANIAERFDLDAFHFVGSLVDDSRPQCIKWVNKEILLKSELPREIAWAERNGSGMIPGTNPENFAVLRGGYNCRHTAIPFRLTASERERLGL